MSLINGSRIRSKIKKIIYDRSASSSSTTISAEYWSNDSISDLQWILQQLVEDAMQMEHLNPMERVAVAKSSTKETRANVEWGMKPEEWSVSFRCGGVPFDECISVPAIIPNRYGQFLNEQYYQAQQLKLQQQSSSSSSSS